MAAPLLSKTRFVSGRQCLRQLWLEVHRRELRPPLDPVTEARFQAGRQVGELARKCFPGGVLVEAPAWDHDEAVARAAELMADRRAPAIFEAGFLHDGVRLRTDVLERGRGGWRLIEVKSSTQPKEEHL